MVNKPIRPNEEGIEDEEGNSEGESTARTRRWDDLWIFPMGEVKYATTQREREYACV